MAKSSRELLVTLGADTTNFSQKIKRAKDLTKELDSNFKMIASSSKDFEKSTEGLAKKQDYLTERIRIANSVSKTYAERMNDQKKILNNVSEQYEKFGKQQDFLKNRLEELKKEGKENSLQFKTLSKVLETVGEKYQKAGKDVRTFTDRMISLRKDFDANQVSIQNMNRELTETETLLSNKSSDAKFEQINEELKENERRFQNLKNVTEGYGKTMSSLVQTQTFYEGQIEKTNQLMDGYSKEIDVSKSKIDELEITMRQLNKAVKEQEQVMDKLDEAHPSFEKEAEEFAKLKYELTTTTTLLESHKERVKELDSKYKSTENSLSLLTGKLMSVGREMRTMSESVTFEKMEKEVKYLNDVTINNLSNKLKELRADFERVSATTDTFDNSMRGLENKLSTYNNMLDLIKRSTKAYEVQIKGLSESLKATENEIKKVERSLSRYEKKLSEMDDTDAKWDKTVAKVKELNERHKDLVKEYDALNNKLNESKSGLESNNKEFNSLSSSIRNVKDNIQKMKESISFEPIQREVKSLAELGFERLSQEIEKTEFTLEKLNNEVDGADKTLFGLHQKTSLLKKSLTDNNSLLKAYKTELKENASSMEQLSKESQQLESELQRLETSLKSDALKGDAWTKQAEQFEKLSAKYKQVNSDLDKQIAKQGELENKIKSSKSAISSLTGEISKTESAFKQLQGENAFKHIEKSLQSVKHEFDLVGAKVEELKSRYINFDNSISASIKYTKLLKEENSILRKEYEQQQRALDLYSNKMSELGNKQQELTNKIKETKLSLLGMEKDTPNYNETIQSISNMEHELDQLENELTEVTNKFREMEIASLGTSTKINENIKGQTATLSAFSNRMKGIGNVFTNVGNSLQSMSGAMMPVTMGISALGAGVVKVGMDFEAQISRLGALSGESGDKLKATMAELEEGARKLGRETQYSATEASKGLEDFMLAGYNATDAIKAMPVAVQMATADNIELNEATELLTTSLSSLGNNSELTGNQVEDLGILANQMAVNAVATTTDMAGLARSFIKVGGQAENLHMPLSTTGTLLGILGDKGVVAEEAGNSLSSILINLTQTTGQSADAMKKLGVSAFDPLTHKMKPVPKILGEIKKKLESFDGDEQEVILKNMLGGKTQAKTLMKLLQGIDSETGDFTDKYKNLKKELENAPKTNALEQMYNKSKDNLKGDIQTLKSTVEDSFITIYKSVQNPLRKIVQSVTQAVRDMTQKWRELPKGTQEFIIKLVLLTATIAPLLAVFGFLTSGIGMAFTAIGSLAGGIGNIIDKFKLLGKEGSTLSGAFGKFKGFGSKISNGMSKVGEGIIGIVGKFKNLGASFVEVMGSGNKVGGLFNLLKGGVASLGEALAPIGAVALPILAGAFVALGVVLGDNEEALSMLQDKWGTFGTVVSGIFEFIAGTFQLTFGNMLIVLKTVGEALWKIVTGDWKNVGDVISKGFAEMDANTAKAMSNMRMDSTRAISAIREQSEKDLGRVQEVFKTTFDTIKNTTDKNTKDVANNLAKSFSDSSGKMLNLSSQTLTILRGTSDTMALLFAGITANMDISQATDIFNRNLDTLVKSGKVSSKELEEDFKHAQEIINDNMVDGMGRTVEEAKGILSEFGQVAGGQIDAGVDDIVSSLDELNGRGIESLRGIGTNWNSILAGIKTDGSQTTEEMKNAILNNLDRLGLDTPEKLEKFKQALSDELETAKAEAGEKGKEVGAEIPNKVEEGVDDGKQEAVDAGKQAGTDVGESTKQGLDESLSNLPPMAKEKLAQAGIAINEQGEVIANDMGQKGEKASSNFTTGLSKDMPAINNVSKQVQDRLAGIDSVQLGNVTKQLSEVNRWLGVVTSKASTTKSSLVGLTNIPFGNTTHGLSEVNQWLMRTQNRAKDTRQPLINLTNLPFGNTTRGLSEVNNWLMRTRNRANDTAKALRGVAGVRFGGVTSGLSQICNWLDTVRRKSNSTSSAINNVSVSRPKITGGFHTEAMLATGLAVQRVATDAITNATGANINNFKTSGGFYSPTSKVAPQSTNSDEVNALKSVLKATLEQNNILMQMLSQERPIMVGVNVDGRQIAKASARYMESEINSINNRKSRLGGK